MDRMVSSWFGTESTHLVLLFDEFRSVNEKVLTVPLKLDVVGAFGRNHVTPRGMTSATMNHMMCVEGVIIKCGLVTPKLLQSMHVRKDQARG